MQLYSTFFSTLLRAGTHSVAVAFGLRAWIVTSIVLPALWSGTVISKLTSPVKFMSQLDVLVALL